MKRHLPGPAWSEAVRLEAVRLEAAALLVGVRLWEGEKRSALGHLGIRRSERNNNRVICSRSREQDLEFVGRL